MIKKLQLNNLISMRIIVIFGVIGVLLFAALNAHADVFDNKINALENQNSATQSLVNGLAQTATSYQDAINQIQGQVESLQAAMAINQNKQAEDQAQIVADQNNIVKQKQLLADEVRSLYMDGSLTTIEQLATSKNLSDFVDQEAYDSQIQSKLSSLIDQITTLESQLQQQKAQIAVLINTETQQNNQLTADQNQQQQLLAYNQSQQNSYNQQIQGNQAQIATLRQEQIAANRALVSNNGGQVITSGSCGGTYPASAVNNYGGHWGCDYSLDNTLDNWGMYNRECVSYTAWMVYSTYGYMPYWGGSGDANEWPGDAEAAGIPVGSTPKVGSVAIYMGGGSDPWGHAMWVTAVNGNMITVQQYNLYYDGNYYETTIDGSGLTYIYFGNS